jgi:hypothetical protein
MNRVIEYALKAFGRATRALGEPKRDRRTAACVGLLVVVWLTAWWPVIGQGKMLSSGASPNISINAVDPGRLTAGVPTMPPPDRFRYDGGASAWQLEPWFTIAVDQWSSGTVPLWTPYQGFGAPLAANFQSAVFDPLLMIPIAVAGVPLGQDVAILGLFLAGMLAAFAFARVLGMTRLAGLTLGVGFGLNGYFLVASNNGWVRLYAFIPILLLLIELMLRRRQARWFAMTVGAVALSIVGGMPEITFMVLMVAGAYALWRVAIGPRIWSRLEALAQLIGALFAGFLLAGPLLLPAAEYVRLSFNTHGGGWAAALTYPAWKAWYIAVPTWGGHPADSPGGVTGWAGTAICALALLGLLSPTRARRLLAVPMVAILATVVGRAYGLLPLEWISSLPILEAIIFDRWGQVPIAFAFTALAAVAVDAIGRGALSRNRALLGSACLIAALLLGWREITDLAAQTPGISPRRELVLAAAAVLAVMIALLLPRTEGWHRSIRIGAVLAVSVVCLELVSYAHAAWPIYATRSNALAAPSWMPMVKKVVSTDPEARIFGLDGRLTPNTAGVFGLQDIGTIEALYPARYFDYVQAFLEPEAVDRFSTWPTFGVRDAVLDPMVGLTGTRWLLQNTGSGLPVGERGTDGDAPVVAGDQFVWVRDLRGALPRAFLVESTTSATGPEHAIAWLKERREDASRPFEPRREAVVETEAALPVGCEDPGSAAITAYSPLEVVIEVQSRCPTILILTDLAYPGWDATVDGSPVDIRPANLAFRSVQVPRGRSEAVFRYEPSSFRTGLAVFALGAVAVGLGTVLIRRRAARAR